jgi:MerR family transcriptional regulator, light-induced transcriptional regulator
MASFIRSGYCPVGPSTRYDGLGFEDCPSAASAAAAHRERADKLRSTVESQIIPRLMMLHGSQDRSRRQGAGNDNICSDFDIVEFSEIILDCDPAMARAYIDRLIDSGIGLDRILLGLMAPAARRLGELWLADVRSFAEVTIGLGQLHQLLRIYGPAFESECTDEPMGCRMVLSPVRGEQHTFGLSLVDLYMRQAGCDVELFPRFELPAMTRRVNTEWVDVIGLSAGCDVLIDELSSDIKSLRRASFNHSVEVIVGGPAFVGHPERVASVGADGFAEDAPNAVRLVSGIMKKSVRG